ncbi:unnamed protein product, partial [Rhizoctonia solani]
REQSSVLPLPVSLFNLQNIIKSRLSRMRGLRKYVLFSLALLDALVATEYLIPALGSRRDTSMLHGLLRYSIGLVDAMKQEGSTSTFFDSFLALGTTVLHLIVRSPIVSVPKAILAEIETFDSILAAARRACTQIGATNVQTVVHDFREILEVSKSALDVTLHSALDLCISTLDRFHHLGMLRSPVAWLYLLFIIYSQLKLACDFLHFIRSVVRVAFRMAHKQAASENLSSGHVDVGIETKDEDIFGGEQWDDSLVTPRSSQRSKRAMSLGKQAARKSLREVLSEL